MWVLAWSKGKDESLTTVHFITPPPCPQVLTVFCCSFCAEFLFLVLFYGMVHVLSIIEDQNAQINR